MPGFLVLQYCPLAVPGRDLGNEEIVSSAFGISLRDGSGNVLTLEQRCLVDRHSVMGDVVSQVELLKPQSMHTMRLDAREAGQDRRGQPAPTGPDPLCRPQRSLRSDLFPHERGGFAQ